MHDTGVSQEGEVSSSATNPGDMAAIAIKLEAIAQKLESRPMVVAPEKPLKSARLEVQQQLNSRWIAQLSQEEPSPVITAVVAEMKARNVLLRKGDANPDFFSFFDNYAAAKPDVSFAECVSEALLKFTEIEASRGRSVGLSTGPIRKRPFRSSGGAGGRAAAAYNFNQSGTVYQLTQQVARLEQQLNGGYGSAQPQQRYQKLGGPPHCYSCKGYGHYAKQCHQIQQGRH